MARLAALALLACASCEPDGMFHGVKHASINSAESSFGNTTTTITFTLGCGDPSISLDEQPTVGDTIVFTGGEQVAFEIGPRDDPDFDKLVQCLTNGADDFICTMSFLDNGGSGSCQPESVLLSDPALLGPDLRGHEVSLIRLNVHNVLIDGDHLAFDLTWELWGPQ